MSDHKHLPKALEILLKRDPRHVMSRKEILETLAEYPPFEDMDDHDLAPIAQAALDRRGAAPAPVQRGPITGSPQGAARPRDPPPAEMLTAPYRFVTIDERVVLAQEETKVANWGFPLANGFTGEIEVDWAFETPMLIGVADPSGVSGPMRLGKDGPHVIPGASLRGMLRAAFGIVTRSRLTQVNKHHTYGVRDFTHPLFKQGAGPGAARLAWTNPAFGAGWLKLQPANEAEKKQGLSDYVLTPCDRKIVRIRALPAAFNGGRPTANGDWHRDWLGLKLGERYAKAGYARGGAPRKPLFDFETTATTTFVPDPSARPNDPTASDHVIPGAGGRAGWFVFSSNSPSLRDIDARTLDEQERSPHAGNQKKREYVFLDLPGAKEHRLRHDVFERFNLINSKPGKTKRIADGSFAVIAPTLADSRRIPVFYSGNLEKQDEKPGFAMGLTRLFKLPHANSVGDILKRQTAHAVDPQAPDMTEALFGHVYDLIDLDEAASKRVAAGSDLEAGKTPEGLARKGRVAFGFATLLDEAAATVTEDITTIAMAPRASFAPFYLRGPIKDYTPEDRNGKIVDVKLAGRKRYFARFPGPKLGAAEQAIRATLTSFDNKAASDSTMSKLRLLKPRASRGELLFRGAIRLHNVTAEEIGALLWTITHGGDTAKPYRHMMGRARNAGAGQARVEAVKVTLEPNLPGGSAAEKIRELEQQMKPGADAGWMGRGGRSLTPFLRIFETHMKACLQKSDPKWPQSDDILEFLGVSDPVMGEALVKDQKAAYLPTPNEHGKLRGLVNANFSKDPDPSTSAKSRLLAVPIANGRSPPIRVTVQR